VIFHGFGELKKKIRFQNQILASQLQGNQLPCLVIT